MNRLTAIGAGVLALALAGCETRPAETAGPAAEAPAAQPADAPAPLATAAPEAAPVSATEALERYYAGLDAAAFPVAPAGPALPSASTALTRILVGSCNNEEDDSPALMTLAGEQADLFLMIGDNVYGDSDADRGRIINEPDLDELRESFANSRPSAPATR